MATKGVTPHPALALLEIRSLFEIALFPAVLPLARHLPAGKGQPVIVMPGFMANDASTFMIRRWLSKLGYACSGWGQGRNNGLSNGSLNTLKAQLEELSEKHGQPVRLVGWSLGGIQARALAHEVPQLVDRVVTLSSPFRLPSAKAVGGPVATAYRRLHDGDLDQLVDPQAQWQYPPPVPSTAIYSYGDGIANWDFCVDRLDDACTENIGVPASHMGMGANPLVMLLLADRLAGHSNEWSGFDLKGWRRCFYSSDDGCRQHYPAT
jgi:pimeloyl-ACP methyl ester carboxylesterase